MKRFSIIFFASVFVIMFIIGNLNAIKKIPQMDLFDIVFISVVVSVFLGFFFFCTIKGNKEGGKILKNIENMSNSVKNIEKKLNE